MREIKFRALALDKNGNRTNIWVYGDYLSHPDWEEIIHYDKTKLIIEEIRTKIDVDTVGQFTGLKDINNKEIYENDLIQNKSGRICQVVWNIDNGCWDAKVYKIASNDDATNFSPSQWQYIEIIGNIFDNEDLLKD